VLSRGRANASSNLHTPGDFMHRLLVLCLAVSFGAPALAAVDCGAIGDKLMAAMLDVVESDAMVGAKTAEECVSEAKEFRDSVDKLRDLNGQLNGCDNALDDKQIGVIDNVVAETEQAIAGCAEVAAEKAKR
jgi:hypothetical protein